MLWIKRLFCKHSFQLAKTYIADGDETIGYKATEFAIIYCPKCKKQRTVTKMSFDVMKEIERINKEYDDGKYDETFKRKGDN